MSGIVIYNSQTGFTKKYAEWISSASGYECIEFSKAKRMKLNDYQTIVFGGWFIAGSISKLKWLKQNLNSLKGKKILVYGVGGSPIESPDIPGVLENLFTEEEKALAKIKCFYCPGGFNYEKMKPKYKLMMKIFLKVLNSQPNKTEKDEKMIEMISSSYDITDKKYIEPILSEINS